MVVVVLVYVLVCVAAVVGQQLEKEEEEEEEEEDTNFNTTWIQDIRHGYKIDLDHYNETQVDRICQCKAICFTLLPCMSWYTMGAGGDRILRSFSSSFTCRLLNVRPDSTNCIPDLAAVSGFGILVPASSETVEGTQLAIPITTTTTPTTTTTTPITTTTPTTTIATTTTTPTNTTTITTTTTPTTEPNNPLLFTSSDHCVDNYALSGFSLDIDGIEYNLRCSALLTNLSEVTVLLPFNQYGMLNCPADNVGVGFRGFDNTNIEVMDVVSNWLAAEPLYLLCRAVAPPYVLGECSEFEASSEDWPVDVKKSNYNFFCGNDQVMTGVEYDSYVSNYFEGETVRKWEEEDDAREEVK
ncbi:hypothetical protein Pmani_019453 [Petrolisthes manimaculis]|uniref:Uncharacterized protein n=1 Tax=Petrolisthes manimaculis TaxID=1843537 RepID=A0AAE1PKR0_9EUCA|nr:hypothetical protein Pmani_019453 [Petrolisthes manimaculis]